MPPASAVWPAALAARLVDVPNLPLPLPFCLQSAQQWTHAHPDWAALSALLRLSGALALAQLLPLALPALQAVAADHERDPRLSLGLLQLAAALLEDDSKAAAWLQPAVGQPLVRAVLLPALVWWAGRVAAAARYAALVAAATLLGKQRLPAEQLVQLAAEGAEGSAAGGASASQQGLLGRIAGCLDEEYEPETRQLACHALQLLLESGARRPAGSCCVLGLQIAGQAGGQCLLLKPKHALHACAHCSGAAAARIPAGGAAAGAAAAPGRQQQPRARGGLLAAAGVAGGAACGRARRQQRRRRAGRRRRRQHGQQHADPFG